MVILGDMVIPYADAFWLDEMLAKLGLLGLVERTGRSTLARMSKDGWFEVERVGRRSRYTITDWGQQVLRQGDLRVFEATVPAWDGIGISPHTLCRKRSGPYGTRFANSWFGWAMAT